MERIDFIAILGIIAALALLGAVIAGIIFAYKFKPFLIENSIFQYQNRDLNTKLIYNITKINTSDTCGSEEEILVLGTWFGSINKYQCKEENKNCTTISGEPKNYTKFNNTVFCVERKGKTYKELIQANQIKNKNAPCPDNYTYCGIIDTLDRKLCVKDDEECPITSQNITYALQNNSSNKYFTNNNNLDLFINEESDINNTLISLIEVGEDYPCMNYSEKVWTTYDANDRNNVVSCSDIGGKELDDRFIQIEGFKINKSDFYKDNELDAYINEEIGKIEVNLYGRVLFGLNYNGEEIDYERMVEIQDNVTTYGKSVSIIVMVMFFLFVIPIALLVFCAGLGAGNASYSGSCDFGDICIAFLKILGGDFAIVSVLGSLANFIVCCLMLSNLIELKGYTKVFENSDYYTNILVESILDSINLDYNYSLAIVILMSISLFLVIVGGITFFFIKSEF